MYELGKLKEHMYRIYKPEIESGIIDVLSGVRAKCKGYVEYHERTISGLDCADVLLELGIDEDLEILVLRAAFDSDAKSEAFAQMIELRDAYIEKSARSYADMEAYKHIEAMV